MIVFDKLWVLIKEMNISTYVLREKCGIDSKTIRRLKANENMETKTLTIENRFGRQRLSVGYGKWASGSLTAEEENTDTLGRISGGEQPVATAGAWTEPDSLTVRIRFIRAPALLDIVFRMRDGKPSVSTKSNMSKIYSITLQ